MMWVFNVFILGINFFGLIIIRCIFNGFEVNLVIYFSIGKLKDMFGINILFIILMCI